MWKTDDNMTKEKFREWEREYDGKINGRTILNSNCMEMKDVSIMIIVYCRW